MGNPQTPVTLATLTTGGLIPWWQQLGQTAPGTITSASTGIDWDFYTKRFLDGSNKSHQRTEQETTKPKTEKKKRRINIMDETQDAQVSALLAAGRAIGGPYTVPPEQARAVFVVPEGYQMQSVESMVESYNPAPRRTKASITLTTADSFVSYVKEHKTPLTRIFVANDYSKNQGAPRYSAYIDFHGPTTPSWVEHSAHLGLTFTPEWMQWNARNASQMFQNDFAVFVEAHLAQILNPSGADMLELIQTLEGTSDARYTSATRLSNGMSKFVYEVDVSLKGNTGTTPGAVEFPTELALALAPFEGGPAYKVTARLRYRLQGGKITFWYELVDLHLVVKTALAEIDAKFSDELGITPFAGSFAR